MNSSELAIFNRLPKEIIDDIIYLRMSRVHSKYMIKHTEILYKYLFLKFRKFYQINPVNQTEYINREFTYHEQLHMMELLNTCECCEEHKKNRPTLSQFLEGYFPPFDKIGADSEKECKCTCRQFSRDICRAHNG